jgi:hypothetical protein
MTDKLDTLLAQLREQPSDHPLIGLELRVQARIGHAARHARGIAGPLRAAMVGLALMLGAGVGALSAASAVAAPKPGLFAAADALAPSTLLDSAR